MNTDIITFELLAEGLLKSGFVLALGLAGAWAFRRSTPEFRHRLWMPLFVIVLVAPALLLLPRWEIVPTLVSEAKKTPAMNLIAFDFDSTDITYQTIGAAETEPLSEPAQKIDWRVAALIVWGAGAVVLILRMMLGCLRVAHWRRRADADLVSKTLFDRTEQLRRELGIPREVTVILSKKVRSPFAWGWRHPLVALPIEAADWSEADLDMILRHELTHLARCDSISVSIAALVTALNWPNPLAWLASKRVTELREQICDREVLSAGCDSERYATLLFGHARGRVAPFPISATAVARPGTLEKRIAMILKTTLHPISSDDQKSSRLGNFMLAGLMAISVAIVFLGLARPALAEAKAEDEPSGNARLIIHTYHDPKTSDISHLGFELNGEEFGFDQLEKKLRPISKQNTVLALAPAAPLPMQELKRVIEVAETAGIRYLIFEKRPKGKDSGGHGDAEDSHSQTEKEVAIVRGYKFPEETGVDEDRSSKITLITTKFVEMDDQPDPVPSPLLKKLHAITIPDIEFADTPLQDALDFLQQRSVELDNQTADPDERGVNMVIKGDAKFRQTPVTLVLSNVSMAQALHFTSQLAGAEIRVDENAVFIQAGRGGRGTGAPALGDDPEARAETERKLKAIRVPMIDLVDTPLEDALMFLKSRSLELDDQTPDPSQRGINIVLATTQGKTGKPATVSLRLKNVTLEDALRYTTDLADHEFRVQGNAVVVRAKPDPFAPVDAGFDDAGGGDGFGFEDESGGGFGGSPEASDDPFGGGGGESKGSGVPAADPFAN